MAKEPASLPASLTFGPVFMILGLSGALAGVAGGLWGLVSLAIALFGAVTLSSGLAWLLRATRSSAAEIVKLREQLSSINASALKS
jgi:hypothetical protein